MIHCANPFKDYISVKAEIDKKVIEFLESGSYVLGTEVQSFEENFAKYSNSKYCVGVASGTDALILSMQALGVKAGDEVITVSHTALATVASILSLNATPVLLDINPKTFTLNPNHIEANITEKTKAIIPVHLYGQPANISQIMQIAKKHNLPVIEDCAQAHGATHNNQVVGSFGDLACFSFYPTKNLGAMGDGGAITTSNEEVYKKLKALRQYGWDDKRVSVLHSRVSRLDEIQAGILNIKLKYLDEHNQRRNQIASQYEETLQEIVTTPLIKPENKSVFHLYVIKTKNRDKLKEFLNENGVGAAIHYLPLSHKQPGYKDYVKLDVNGLACTEKVVHEILSLPIYPLLEYEEQSYVIKQVKEFFDG